MPKRILNGLSFVQRLVNSFRLLRLERFGLINLLHANLIKYLTYQGTIISGYQKFIPGGNKEAIPVRQQWSDASREILYWQPDGIATPIGSRV